MPKSPIRLNLGAGRDVIEGWTNLDITPTETVDIVFDLETCSDHRLPLDDSSVVELRAQHILEHIDRILPLMQELHRVAEPGALLRAAMPHAGHDDAWADPTHRRAMSLRSFNYFQQPFYTFADYGYEGDWEPTIIYYTVSRRQVSSGTAAEILKRIEHERNLVMEMMVDLRAVKPVRKRDRTLLSVPKVQIVLAE